MVQGRFAHVSFIIDPVPLRVTVREVVPPYPPKLLDQAQRVLGLAETLPPMELVPDVVEFDLARAGQYGHQLPAALPGRWRLHRGATVRYLDERPAARAWLLLGCERSEQIHECFYGERAPQVDICPRSGPAASGATLAKCCLLETHNEVDADRARRRALGRVAGADRRGAGRAGPRCGSRHGHPPD